jgi:hypothetical protein
MRSLFVLVLSAGFLLPAFSLDRNAFTFTKYDLNVRLETNQRRLAVRGKIALRNDSATPQKDLVLQISSSLDWRVIALQGKPLDFVSQPYLSDIDHTGALSEALVRLPREVQPKETIELDVGYEGVVLLDTTRLTRIGVPEDAARRTDWDQIGKSFSAVRGIGYVVWYPVSTEAANLSVENAVSEVIGLWRQRETQANMRVDLCLWKNSGGALTQFMNDRPIPQKTGQTTKASDEALDCQQHDFAPLNQTVPLLVVGTFEALAHPAISVAYSAEHKTAAGNYALAADNVIPFITQWFGPPQHSARLVELPDPAASPYENGDMLLTPLASVDVKLLEIAAVHQLTHAAFRSARLWIDEGLAHFAQAMYREQQSNRDMALQYMEDHLPALVDAEKGLASEQGPDSSEQSLINTGIEELYRSKAMYVWWMLRDMLGDPALRQGLAAYRPDHDTIPSYLQHLIESQSKRDLGWFFDDWVYHDRGLPDFRIDSVYSSPTTQRSFMVTVTVEDLGAAGAEVPVTVTAGEEDFTKRLEVHGKSKNSIRIVVPSLPQRVVVNDGSVPESDMTNNGYTLAKP